jgi:hypothetical protein
MNSRLDVAGGVAAGVCAVHCLLTPVLLAYGGLGLAGTAISERAEVAFVLVSLVVGLVSLGPAFLRHHRDPVPIALFVTGLGSLLLVRSLGAPRGVERCIVPMCATLIIVAHARNHRSCRRCRVCDAPEQAEEE